MLVVGTVGLLVASACAATGVDESSTTTPTTTTTTTTTTSTVPATTSTGVGSPDQVGLYRASPDTLAPATDTPITTGDWLSGRLSPSGRWLVLNVWIDTEPDTDVIRVIDTDSETVVTDVTGPLMHDLTIDDDGAVFNLFQSTGSPSLGRLERGATEFEVVFNDFPNGFAPLGSTAFLGDGRLAWLGSVPDGSGDWDAMTVVADLADGSADRHTLDGVAVGMVGEQDFGDWVAPEIMEPAVVWDREANRALVVHADRPAVTEVDLESGEVTEHAWAEEAAGAGRLMAWLIPPAGAKGPSFGSSRQAVLDASGNLLYVGSVRGEALRAEDGSWSVESIPQGIEVISTQTWERVSRFDIPASRVYLAPGGEHLVATGMASTDTISSTEFRPEGVFIVRTDTMDLVGHVKAVSDWGLPDIQFSGDGTVAYATSASGAQIQVIDLATAEVTNNVRGIEQLTVFGEAALISTTSVGSDRP